MQDDEAQSQTSADAVDDPFETVVFYEQRATVRAGQVMSESRSSTSEVVDRQVFDPQPADVEAFRVAANDAESEWRIVGFGTDEHALTGAMARRLDEIVQLTRRAS